MKYVKTFGANKLFENNTFDIDDILSKISSFIESTERNKWIFNDSIKIYIRKSKRYYNGALMEFFDFANIEVYERGKGFFTEVLHRFEDKYPDKNIFIESVLTNRFAEYIENKLGFHRMGDQNNFYKIK